MGCRLAESGQGPCLGLRHYAVQNKTSSQDPSYLLATGVTISSQTWPGQHFRSGVYTTDIPRVALPLPKEGTEMTSADQDLAASADEATGGGVPRTPGRHRAGPTAAAVPTRRSEPSRPTYRRLTATPGSAARTGARPTPDRPCTRGTTTRGRLLPGQAHKTGPTRLRRVGRSARVPRRVTPGGLEQPGAPRRLPRLRVDGSDRPAGQYPTGPDSPRPRPNTPAGADGTRSSTPADRGSTASTPCILTTPAGPNPGLRPGPVSPPVIDRWPSAAPVAPPLPERRGLHPSPSGQRWMSPGA